MSNRSEACQAMAKVKDMEAAMIAYFADHAGDAGVGLEILPGVARLLTSLHVRRTDFRVDAISLEWQA